MPDMDDATSTPLMGGDGDGDGDVGDCTAMETAEPGGAESPRQPTAKRNAAYMWNSTLRYRQTFTAIFYNQMFTLTSSPCAVKLIWQHFYDDLEIH